MPSASCSTHTDRNANYRCEGCHRALCDECVEEGHRLLFCRHCRERALPLADGGPTTTPDPRRARRGARPDRLSDAFVYAFRGRGALTLPAYALFVAFTGLIPALFGLVLMILVAILVPGFLFQIVRSTWEEDDELPDWPDYSAFWERLGEWRDAAGIGVAAVLPSLLFRRLADCDVESFLVADRALCAASTAAGVALGFAIGLFGLGAVGAFGSGWLGFRIDLHLEALLVGTRGEAPLFALLAALLLGAGLLAARLLAGIPFLGAVALHTVAAYCAVTGAHLAGLLFRRHRGRLETIYLS